MSDPFYILSIDGGGLRGAFAAHLLKRVEEELKIDWCGRFVADGWYQHRVDSGCGVGLRPVGDGFVRVVPQTRPDRVRSAPRSPDWTGVGSSRADTGTASSRP